MLLEDRLKVKSIYRHYSWGVEKTENMSQFVGQTI